MRKRFFQRTAAVMLSASLLLSNAGSALADTETTAVRETEAAAEQEAEPDSAEETTEETSSPKDVTFEQEEVTEETGETQETAEKTEKTGEKEASGEPESADESESSGETESSGEMKTEAAEEKKTAAEGKTADATEDSDVTESADEKEAAKQTEAATKKAQAEAEATGNTATAGTEAATTAEAETTSSADADTIIYNLGSKEVEVSDARGADHVFEDDGSYTISITEANPYFPYEVQFKCGDETTEEWFKSPADTVSIHGHAFSVQLDGAATEKAYTTLSLQVGDEEVLVYPEEKTFTDSTVSRFGRMLMAAFRVVSKRDETKTALNTVDLSAYSPLELSRVQLHGLFSGKTIEEGQKVMWTSADDEALAYTVSNPDDSVDLSVNTYYGGTNKWRMLVGADDQLKDGTIYTVPIKTAATKSWLQAKANAVKADGTSTALTVSNSNYYDSESTDRRLEVSVNGDRSISYDDVRYGFSFNEEKFQSLSGKTLKIYEGEAETEQALSGLQDITEQILSGSYQEPENHEEDIAVTIVGYSGDALIGILPVRLSFYLNGEYLSLVNGLRDEAGTTVSQSYKRSYTKGELSEYTIEYSMKEGKAVDGSYYARFKYYKNNSVDNSQVTAVYLGTYRTIAEAQKAGAAEVKDQILSDSGYQADYSNGVHFTFFMGNDGEASQEVERYCIKTKEYQKIEEEEYLSSDTYVQFTGLLDKDKKEIPCYFLKESADSYGEYNFPTLMVAENVDLSEVYPQFETRNGITLYAKGSATAEESGESEHDLSGGILQYTASSEDKEFQRNYWLQVIKPTDGTKLFINSFADKDAKTETKDGVIYSTREIMLDSYHNNRHDIILFNRGTSAIENIKVELESDVLELDDYWTLKGSSNLSGYADDEDSSYVYSSKSGLTDRAVNMADVRLTAKDDAKNGSDISGELTFKSGNTVLAVLTLTGTIGDPTIITEEIPDAVKYVPYGTMIQNSNKYSWNHPTYELYSGRLPKGMEILENGELYGVPQETGEFTFTVSMENDFSSRSYGENSSLDEYSVQTHKYTMKVAENTDDNVEAATYAGYELRPDTANDPYNGRVPDFRITDSATEYTLVSNGAYAEFKYIWLDGEKLVEGSDYTSSEGSTRITLKTTTLKKNGEGTHTLGIEFRTKKGLNTSNTSGQKRTSADGTFERAAQNYHIGSKSSSNTSKSSGGSSGGSGKSAEVVPVYGPANTMQVLSDGTWKRSEDGTWSFIGTDGKPVTGFKYLNTKNGAKWFYFYQNGTMATGWIVTEDGKWYYMLPEGDQQGAMQTGFVLDPSDHHWYMLKETSGELLTGWQTSNGKYYYFNAVPGKQGTSGWGYSEESKKWFYTFMPTFAYGAMYQSATTPDGYQVDADGAWVK